MNKRRLSFVMEVDYAIRKSRRINHEVIKIEQKQDLKQQRIEQQTKQDL